jgi:hypothetical protein
MLVISHTRERPTTGKGKEKNGLNIECMLSEHSDSGK